MTDSVDDSAEPHRSPDSSSAAPEAGLASVGGQPARRFIVGIDLGTTNSAVCCVDTESDASRVETFRIPQIVAPGQVENRETLPSFHYQPVAAESADGQLGLPWETARVRSDSVGSADVVGSADAVASAAGPNGDRGTVGVYARDHGRMVTGRLVESAKSWLCHAGVDRRANLLPWHGAADTVRMSPVEVSACYLRHIRLAWDAAHPDFPLAEQDVVLTIPASFDEVARELTVAAAKSAGLPRLVLIEEPQAAFYAWVHEHRDSWEQQVQPGQKILICDIGGGTSDFTLIHVRRGEGDRLKFHRVAVGDHLLLGGDNLDLALAHHLEQRLVSGKRLEPRQWSVLVSACRQVKETLLGENAPERMSVTLPGSGSKLIGGSLQAEVSRDEVIELLIQGFLPEVKLTDRPARRQSGFQEFGLPYAADAAITRYLAAFLTDHQATVAEAAGSAGSDLQDDSKRRGSDAAHPARPDIVLFNGGFFASPTLRTRLLDVLQSWFRNSDAAGWSPLLLKNDRLDLAVARGAAVFGLVRRGIGTRITAGLPRTYYVGIADESSTPRALCLIAAGTEPSAELHAIDREFTLLTSEPVEFPIHVSSTRLTDQAGALVDIDAEQMSSLPPIRTILRSKKSSDRTVRARLSARLTEIGTLEMWCQQADGPRRWQLQFDVRSAVETEREAHIGRAEQSGIVDQSSIDAASAVLAAVFGDSVSAGIASPGSGTKGGAAGTITLDGLTKGLAAAVDMSRGDWPPSLLRSLWSSLMEHESGRRKSEQHETRWLNLLGFSLRPGFGMAADDWRVEETWKRLRGQPAHSGAACEAEWWILWRRIAGGLTPGRQIELTSAILPLIRREHKQVVTGRGKGAKYAAGNHSAAEVWRMLGAMELLPLDVRIELGGIMLDNLPRRRFDAVRPALLWALGRIGARVPVYGPLNIVLPPDIVAEWIERIQGDADLFDPVAQLALMQLARRTGDRFRDLTDDQHERTARLLQKSGARPHFIELVREGGALDTDEERLVFGEALPAGLRL